MGQVLHRGRLQGRDPLGVPGLCTKSGFFGDIFFLLFRDKISEFRINCFKFTQYFAKISRLILLLLLLLLLLHRVRAREM